MKYSYSVEFNREKPNDPPLRRPRISLELFGPARTVNVAQALIDSGADVSLFNMESAALAGLDLTTAQRVDITGIGSRIPGLLTSVEICVQHLEPITIPAWFVDSANVHVLLGQAGFFDAHRIKFERDHHTFEVIPSRKKRP